jgi:hypothetical protein
MSRVQCTPLSLYIDSTADELPRCISCIMYSVLFSSTSMIPAKDRCPCHEADSAVRLDHSLGLANMFVLYYIQQSRGTSAQATISNIDLSATAYCQSQFFKSSAYS